MRIIPSLPLLLALTAAGCITVGGSGGDVDRRSYDLAAPFPAAGPLPPADGPEVLSVEPFSADAALEREELVWRRGAVESGAWENYRWVRPPEQGMREILASAVARSGAVAAVATEPAPSSADLRMRGHLARCEEEDGPDGWWGVLEVRLEVADARTGEEVLRRTYARREKAAARNPTAVVEALRRAAEAVSLEAATDVRTVLEARRTSGDGTSGEGAPGDR
jgi:ABC-type uncharacterized transport system auxiliary subunit